MILHVAGIFETSNRSARGMVIGGDGRSGKYFVALRGLSFFFGACYKQANGRSFRRWGARKPETGWRPVEKENRAGLINGPRARTGVGG
jgi:hypothetical protein